MPTADNHDSQRLDDAAQRLRQTVQRFTGRRREVFERLLGFETEKEIAQALAVSRHTIHGYAKIIYAMCNVHTRKELRLLFVFGQQPAENESPTVTDSV